MKRINLSVFLVAILAIALSSCNALKKMAKRMDEVKWEVTPNPAEMHGDSINITLNVNFPEKYFHKKVSGTVTPKIKWDGGEVAFAPLMLKGEASEADGKVINYKAGGKATHTAKIPYQDGMHKADIMMHLNGKFKKKEQDFDPIKAADATIITPKYIMPNDRPILGADKFVKFVMMALKTDIHYVVNQSGVRGSELGKDDFKQLKADLKKYTADPKAEFTGVNTDAYASPEGELSKNDNLANERAESANKAMVNILKRAKIEGAGDFETFYKGMGKGEDWAGFKTLMEASDIKDKELILRVLEMYTDLNKREEEIKNLAATYNEVAKKILPELRKSNINVNIKYHSKTDEEINALLASKPDSLTEEEILYAATLTNDLGEKEKIYKTFVTVYPKDWRGPNNVGYVYIMQNKVSEAKAEFEKAAGISADNGIIENNLGVCARLSGDIAKAKEHYEKASGAGPEVSYNMGIVNIVRGDYAGAVSNFSGEATYNAALAQTLNGNPDGASKTLENAKEKDDAWAYYLKAIIGARTSNKDMIVNNLKTCVGKDGSFKARAKDDREFIKYFNDAEFQAAVN